MPNPPLSVSLPPRPSSLLLALLPVMMSPAFEPLTFSMEKRSCPAASPLASPVARLTVRAAAPGKLAVSVLGPPLRASVPLPPVSVSLPPEGADLVVAALAIDSVGGVTAPDDVGAVGAVDEAAADACDVAAEAGDEALVDLSIAIVVLAIGDLDEGDGKTSRPRVKSLTLLSVMTPLSARYRIGSWVGVGELGKSRTFLVCRAGDHPDLVDDVNAVRKRNGDAAVVSYPGARPRLPGGAGSWV